MCIGSYIIDLMDDPHTQVCNENQPYFYSQNRDSEQWSYFYLRSDVVNSICGFGKEEVSARSKSFISLAYNRGDLKKLIYSFEIQPILASYSANNSHKLLKEAHEKAKPVESDETDKHNNKKNDLSDDEVPSNKNPFKFGLPGSSTMTIGGYDTNDFVGDLNWYDTSDCPGAWNITGTDLNIGDNTNINPEAGADFEIEFQIGYPYVSVPESSWDTIKELIGTTLNAELLGDFVCSDS